MSDTAAERPRDRLATGIAGLDTILHGGLVRRGVYMVQGRPGGGKTILANQLCFHHAAQGGRVLYITLLTETHERMLFNLEQLSFFDPSLIPDRLTYVSAFSFLEDSGLKGLTEMLRREARLRQATLLVVDGLVAAAETADTKKDFKKFIHELQIHANLLGCTILLLSSEGAGPVGPEHTMVDGVIEVSDNRHDRRTEREIEVKKFRGSSYLRGGHAFQITPNGIEIFPRLEALLADPPHDDECTTERVSTGVATIDEALHGGLRCSSSSVLFGTTGTGKTTLGLHFLNQSSATEPGLLFGFYEPPPRILLKAQTLGLDLAQKKEQGIVDIMWFPPAERMLDALAHRLLTAVRARGVKRLFVDGVDGFLSAASYPHRINQFLTALTNELRTHGVTTLYTVELHELFSSELTLPMQGMSSLVENIMLLRFVEQEHTLRRMFSIVKTRDSAYDSSLRELTISSRGAELGAPLQTTSASGSSLKASFSPGSQLRRLLKVRGRKP
jgi:circadian clock protein KaiC